MTTTITDVLDLGNDVIEVRGTIDGITHFVDGGFEEREVRFPDGHTETRQVRTSKEEMKPLAARGWLSAMTNHYDAKAYGEDGHIRRGAKPRAMTADEQLAYAKRLLEEANPLPAAAVQPASLGIRG